LGIVEVLGEQLLRRSWSWGPRPTPPRTPPHRRVALLPPDLRWAPYPL